MSNMNDQYFDAMGISLPGAIDPAADEATPRGQGGVPRFQIDDEEGVQATNAGGVPPGSVMPQDPNRQHTPAIPDPNTVQIGGPPGAGTTGGEDPPPAGMPAANPTMNAGDPNAPATVGQLQQIINYLQGFQAEIQDSVQKSNQQDQILQAVGTVVENIRTDINILVYVLIAKGVFTDIADYQAARQRMVDAFGAQANMQAETEGDALTGELV